MARVSISNMSRCPLFDKCGGCKFDFTSDEYRANKIKLLKDLPLADEPIWLPAGARRRGDFAFTDNVFGFFARGSKNIIPVKNCPALVPEINRILPIVAAMPWAGSGSALLTLCDNGIAIDVVSNVPYFTSEFKNAADAGPAIRISWNGKIVSMRAQPIISFDDVAVDYPIGTFLQPGKAGESVLRELVIGAAAGCNKVADLFGGLGNFTYALNADGFDLVGAKNIRDLFKNPLSLQNLKKYDCVVMDPPRAGANAQSKYLSKSGVRRIIYVSCNPESFLRDKVVLEKGGYKLSALRPVDQFVGTAHWELVGVFNK